MHKTTNPTQKSQEMEAPNTRIHNGKERKKSKKRIVSYSLNVELLHQIRKVAQRQDRYYSSIVSDALKNYIQQELPNNEEEVN